MAERNAETGSGNTPRNGAGSIATDTAARPRPARICVIRPPNECPTTAGLRESARTSSSRWSATCLMLLPANSFGFARAAATVSGRRANLQQRSNNPPTRTPHATDPSCGRAARPVWNEDDRGLAGTIRRVDLFALCASVSMSGG